MQTFNKKQIAIAVGAALATGAAAAAAPAVRTNGALATDGVTVAGLSQIQKQTLLNPATTATGVANTAFNARLVFGTGKVMFLDSTGAAIASTTASTAFINDSQASVGAFFVYTTDTSSAKIKLNATVTADSTTVAAADSTSQAMIGLTITPVAAAQAIRFQGGKLQFTDTSFGAGVWRDVKLDLNADTTASTTVGRTAIVITDENLDSTLDSGDSRIASAINVTSVGIGQTLVPTAVAYTRATAGKIDGAKIETFTPLTAFAATNVVVKTVANNSVTNNNVADTTFSAGSDTTTASTSLYQVFWTAPQSVNWVTDSTVADSSAYNALSFNTGIADSAVPFAFSTDTSVTPALYSAAFVESTGSNAPFATGAAGFPAVNTYHDGVAPVALSSQYDTSTSELEIVFSEAIAVNAGINTSDDNEREVVENISHKVGTTSTTLAAEAFNANALGGAAIGFTIDTPAGTGVAANSRLLLTAVPKAVLDTATAHTIEINSRLTIADPGDANFSTAAALDLEGGLKASAFGNFDTTVMAFNVPATAVALQTIGGGTNVTVAREVLPSVFDSTGNVTAAAFLTSDNTKIQTIVVTFPGVVTVDSTATLTDQFVIELKDSNSTPFVPGDGQAEFRFIPTAAQVTGGGTTKLTFTLPTTLEPANARDTWTIEYLGTNNVLKDANGQNYAAGDVPITLPFTASNTTVGLYTMDAKLPLVGAAPGSRLTTFVARWNDVGAGERFDTTGANSGFTFRSGRISNPNDKVATDILLEPRDGNWGINGGGQLDTLATAIAVELNKIGTTTKPAPITLYVQLIRNADVQKNANNQDADYLQARALFSTDPTDVDVGSIHQVNAEVSPTYVVQLDPVTGNITGRLTGRLDIASKRTQGSTAGLVFLDSNGSFGSFGSAVKSASVLDSSSAGRIFIGADRKVDPKTFDGAFLLAVLEQNAAGVDLNTLVTSGDPGRKNFFPFLPSLDVKDPTKVGRQNLTPVPLAQLRTTALTNSTAWQLVGIGNFDRALPVNEKDVPKGFISYTPSGAITLTSRWLGDGATTDLALTMVGNGTALAVESATGTKGNLAPKGNAAAFALMDDAGTTDKLSFLLKPASDASTPNGIGSATGLGLPAGWSLVAIPAGLASTAALPANVSMVLKVGAQRGVGGAVSWVTGDPAQTFTQNEPVFFFAKAPIPGK